jgi:hypothetical protein
MQRKIKLLILATTILSGFAIGDARADAFVTTGSLKTGRYDHTATLLTDGRVLVAGGYNTTNGGLSSAEIYNPATGRWADAALMSAQRVSHTANRLPSGRVLVVGGSPGIVNAEAYDPAAGAWVAAGTLSTGRYGHTATVLGNGKLLVAGGFNVTDGLLNSAELYDYTTGTWTTTGSMGTPRYGHTAVLLPDGKVLAAGGEYSTNNPFSGSPTAELYDPATGQWTQTGDLSSGRFFQTATLLPDGKVLLAGGFGYLSSAELYDPASGGWATTGQMSYGREFHAATLLPSGRVLVTGGANSAFFSNYQPELYVPNEGRWTGAASMAAPRLGHTATLLADGRVLIVGGNDGENNSLASAELYQGDPGPTNTPPIARCRNVLKSAGEHCQAPLAATEVDDGSSDPDGDPISLSLAPPGPYALGTNLVTLTVTDSRGASDSCTALVIVQDTTPPEITCPGNITVDLATLSGAPVSFVVTAVDNCTTAPQVTCVPASGSTFPIGTTSVACTAVDLAGNSSSCLFQVTVLGPCDILQRLLALVNARAKRPQPLAATLAAALASVERGNYISAVNQLKAFQHQVSAQVASSEPELAQTLVQEAQRLINAIR